MNKKKFISVVQGKFPCLACVDGYFYMEDPKHILSGFFCEITPNGAYIWKFLFPLFTKAERITLTFSERLRMPAGYINFDNTSKSLLPEEFCNRVTSYIPEVRAAGDLAYFINLFSQNSMALSNPHVKRALALAMILADDNSSATALIEKLIKELEVLPSYKTHLNDCKTIQRLLLEDPLQAKILLHTWENDCKVKLGIL